MSQGPGRWLRLLLGGLERALLAENGVSVAQVRRDLAEATEEPPKRPGRGKQAPSPKRKGS
jgi:hypothetical protein